MLEVIDTMNTDTVNATEFLATDFTPETVEAHNELGEAITNLWSAHVNARNTARATNEELRGSRAKLGEQLSELKQILSKPGRDGQWSGFLREHNIPRATGERLVARHQLSLNQDENCATEEFAEPTEEDVQKLFVAVWPKLRRTLRSRQSLQLFVDLLTSHCEHVELTVHEIPAVMPAAATDDPPSSDGDSMVEPEFLSAMPPGPDQGVMPSRLRLPEAKEILIMPEKCGPESLQEQQGNTRST